MSEDQLKQAKDEDIATDPEEEFESVKATYSITSYGADYPVDGIVKRINNGDVFVPRFSQGIEESTDIVGFQREYVWSRYKADRFVESLLLGLPVPGIFLVKEENGKLLVLDGHQRLVTLQAFYEGIIHGKEYLLSGVAEQFEGKSYRSLDVADRRRLDDSIIHATIIRQDEPSNDQSSIYSIFERLNTGGVNLQPQEIRSALYNGNFAQLMKELNEDKYWRSLVGRVSKRQRDIEMILRFFAFLYYRDRYEGSMKGFLNTFMSDNRSCSKVPESELRSTFSTTVERICSAIGDNAFKPKRSVNAAVLDSIMVGVALSIKSRVTISDVALKANYEELMKNPEYVAFTETGTSKEDSVNYRMDQAIAAFKGEQ